MHISPEYVPNVLLLGNGINRANDFVSWSELIDSIKTVSLTKKEKKCIENVPYPLQPVILTDDKIDEKMKEVAENLTELKAANVEEELLRKFARLSFDAILTTNYTYELEKSICPDFTCKVSRRCKYRKTTEIQVGKDTKSLLHTFFELGNDVPPIWHIHGEAAKPNTMILGHYYYGKLISRIQHYISRFKRLTSSSHFKDHGMNCMSWIDYFMMGNVYIVGCGLDFSEIDLWWLVNCKKRHFPKKNIILFKPDIKIEEKLLADAYGIEVRTEGLIGDDYNSYYAWVYEKLSEMVV